MILIETAQFYANMSYIYQRQQHRELDKGVAGEGFEPLLSEEEAGEAPQSEYPLSKISVDEESMLISVSAVHVNVLAFAAKSLLHSM